MDLKLPSQEDTIRMLEGLLKQALNGDIIEIAGVAMLVDGNFRVYQSRTEDKYKTAGHLLDAAIDRLSYVKSSDLCNEN